MDRYRYIWIKSSNFRGNCLLFIKYFPFWKMKPQKLGQGGGGREIFFVSNYRQNKAMVSEEGGGGGVCTQGPNN